MLGVFVMLALFVSCGDKELKKEDFGRVHDDGTLFSLLPPSRTGVAFENPLTEGPNTNLLVYEYFYNGGGVGTGDFNGDGLPDLYFVANMADNKLYLNQGGLSFRDVTTESGASGRAGPWKTGVAVVDINLDGLDDIYLSYSGMLPPNKRRNQLFINQGIGPNDVPTFRDEAPLYGLDLPSFTNQAYFFDYDQDGDLDALLLNHNPKLLPILNVEQTRQLLALPDPDRGLRLLRNQDNRFTDVTEAAGINGSALSYGLSLSLSDINLDGLPDFYVSNDYEVPDYLYINNGDGTFTDRLAEQLTHTSHFSMGSDIADVDNDGLPDIVTLDMLPADNERRKLLMADDNRSKHDLSLASGFHEQTMRNMLHLNRGNETFAEVGQLAGIATTDWSWSALLADFDNDGYKDLHVTNGYVRDYTNQDFIKYMDDFVADHGRLKRADVLELLKKMPASNVSNQAFRNRKNGTFENVTQSWGLDRPSTSNGAVAVDLDKDGDLDLVVNTINQAALIYRNNAADRHFLQVQLTVLPGQTATGARVTLSADSLTQTQELYPNRGYLSTGPTLLHFGLGAQTQVQSLTVEWPDGTQQVLTDLPTNQRISLRKEDAVASTSTANMPPPVALYEAAPSPVDYTHELTPFRDFDRQALLPKSLSDCGPILATGDLNGDGLTDLVIGGTQGKEVGVYLQRTDGGFKPQSSAAFAATAAGVTSQLVLRDMDADGDLDLYVANAGYHDFSDHFPALADQLFINDGQASFTGPSPRLPVLPSGTGSVAISREKIPEYVFVGGSVIPGKYPLAAPSRLLRRDERGAWRDVSATANTALVDLGIVTDAEWHDLDQDGNDELIVVGQYMPIRVFNLTNGKLTESSEHFFDQPTQGWWNVLHLADLNGDGFTDLLVGNEGDNHLYPLSPHRSAYLFKDDIDGNGSIDPILTVGTDTLAYPDPTRDELLAQVPQARTLYTDYASYARTTAGDLLAQLGVTKGALTARISRTTMYLRDPRTGKFLASPLPIQAQYAPIHTILTLDADGDGITDILLAGNEIRASLRRGSSDANTGILLRGLGAGKFVYVPQVLSGFNLRGAVRSVIHLDDQLIFGAQGQALQVYRKTPLPVR